MRIDGPSRCFVANDRISRLSPTQATVLAALIDRQTYVSLDSLAEIVDRNRVSKELTALRRILADHGLGLLTVRGKGYRIVNGG